VFVFYRVVASPCDDIEGSCIDTNYESCDDGMLKVGYCPGPSNIKCCLPKADVPNECLGDGPSLPESIYEFTLDNQGFAGHPGALVYVPKSYNMSVSDLVSNNFMNSGLLIQKCG
jgi:hypothetical protein